MIEDGPRAPVPGYVIEEEDGSVPKSYRGRDPEKRRAYMRDYMRRYRARKKERDG